MAPYNSKKDLNSDAFQNLRSLLMDLGSLDVLSVGHKSLLSTIQTELFLLKLCLEKSAENRVDSVTSV